MAGEEPGRRVEYLLACWHVGIARRSQPGAARAPVLGRPCQLARRRAARVRHASDYLRPVARRPIHARQPPKLGDVAGAERRTARCGTATRVPPTWPGLFWRPGFGAEEGCCCADHATFELQCRLNPGPGHFQQDLAVPFRLGIAGPTQTLLRELAEVFGRCWHGALRTENRGERDRSLSHRRLRASRCR